MKRLIFLAGLALVTPTAAFAGSNANLDTCSDESAVPWERIQSCTEIISLLQRDCGSVACSTPFIARPGRAYGTSNVVAARLAPAPGCMVRASEKAAPTHSRPCSTTTCLSLQIEAAIRRASRRCSRRERLPIIYPQGRECAVFTPNKMVAISALILRCEISSAFIV